MTGAVPRVQGRHRISPVGSLMQLRNIPHEDIGPLHHHRHHQLSRGQRSLPTRSSSHLRRQRDRQRHSLQTPTDTAASVGTSQLTSIVRFLSGSVKPQDATGNEDFMPPKKKTWDKTAVLQALAYTVNHRLYSVSKESGRNAAKYIFNTFPNLFLNDIAEPHIPCLMPETLQPLMDSVSEEALNERIQLRRVKASVDMFDQLLQGGSTPSIETTNRLLDLLCFYGDLEPNQLEQRQSEESENGGDSRRRNGRTRNADKLPTWRQNNNAERIFNLMPERNSYTFCTMIRGMVKHGSPAKAFSMYTDLLNNRMNADVHTFNALILAAPETKERHIEKLDFILELLKHMVEQKVQPTILTFNCVLNSMRLCGSIAKGPALKVLNEMKALNVAPSLATFYHLLGVFYKPAVFDRGQVGILAEILDELEGKSFTAQDPDDVYFFSTAMRLCLELKDVDLAYRLYGLAETGDNWKLLGDHTLHSMYYGRFLTVLTLIENIDVVMKWYRELVPSRFFPNHRTMSSLLQALEMESRLDLVPQIWKDIKLLGYSNNVELVEEVLRLMARNEQPQAVQNLFSETVLDIKSLYTPRPRVRVILQWSAGALGDATTLLVRAGRTKEAWETFGLFKTENRVPRSTVINMLLDSAKTAGNSSLAIDLVQQAVAFSLPNVASLARRVTEEFSITEEQRITLEDIQTHGPSSSSSSESSDSDDDRDGK
uniref:Small ribosomal subunit protein mS39 n=1 Tax=Leptobrachium leishanense TaxID=445787 RepID=A0A8C5M7F5_9ANUR